VSLVLQNHLLQKIELNSPASKDVSLSILRLDRLHELGGGNKRFKLKYNLKEARAQGKTTLLSFGGAWSNHIHALAAAGLAEGFKTLGIIRGEAAHGLTPTLQDAQAWGMELHFVSRSDYRLRGDKAYLQVLKDSFDNCYIIPEGGANDLGAKGCADIVQLIDNFNIDYNLLACACGTGSTLAGIVSGISVDKEVLGISVLKGLQNVEAIVAEAVKSNGSSNKANWKIRHEYHHGGYARVSTELKSFILDFEQRYRIALDPVYTGKLLFGLFDMIEKGELNDRRIIAIHSGGLQGRRGYDWLTD